MPLEGALVEILGFFLNVFINDLHDHVLMFYVEVISYRSKWPVLSRNVVVSN